MTPTSTETLSDREQIVDLAVRYATALDSRDWDLLRTCFTPDAVAEYVGIGDCNGYDAIESLCKSALTPLDRTQHLLGNQVAEVNGDEATASCYLQAQHVRSGVPGGDKFIIAGKYIDRFVRTPDGWRI